MTVTVKICGINSVAAADAAARAGADFAGLVFFPPSPRHVTADQAAALAARLRGGPRLVALLVDAEDEAIAAAIAAAAPAMLQLHGRESPERSAAIRARFGLPVIKAIAVAESADLAGARAYEPVADYLLFDAKAPESASRPGGHGAAFDWKLLSGAGFKRPWLLAGGLTPENVERAVRASGAGIVDTSSGVEDAPGAKNPEKIAAFVRAARSAPYTEQKRQGAA
jgi:phosphoribosylanthranilate isomerase